MGELVSIIVPVYNQEKYIDKCLQSLINQAYDNYEVIIVNDGSTDNSLEICNSYIDVKNITLINQRNQGVSVARNVGLEQAIGEWVSFVDPDDYVERDYLEKLIDCVNDEVDIVISGCIAFDNDSDYCESFFGRDFEVSSKEEKRILYKQLLDAAYGQPGKVFTACGVPWGKLYRRTILLSNNVRFEPSLIRMQDNIFNMYAFYFARKIIYVDFHIYHYRVCHVSDYVDKLNPQLENVLVEVRKARELFFSRYNIDDKELEYYYNKEAYDFVKWYFNGFLYNKSNDMRKNDRINALSEFISKSEFEECIKKMKYSDLIRKKEKLYLFALRNRIGWLVDILVRNNHWIIG